MSDMRWRKRNDYDEADGWECFVMAHAVLVGARSVFFTDKNYSGDQVNWVCKRFSKLLGALG